MRFPTIRNKVRMSPLSHHFILEDRTYVIKQRNKHILFRKEEIKLSFFTNDMVVYAKNPKKLLTKKLWRQAITSKLQKYEIKNTIPCTQHPAELLSFKSNRIWIGLFEENKSDE